MELKELLQLKHGRWDRTFNLKLCPLIECGTDIERFNEIYLSLNALLPEWRETILASSGVPSKDNRTINPEIGMTSYMYNQFSRYIFDKGARLRVLFIIGGNVWYINCGAIIKSEDALQGYRAFQEFLYYCHKNKVSLDKWNLGNDRKAAQAIKDTIPKPRIQLECKALTTGFMLRKEIGPVAHIDIHSAYAGGLSVVDPGLAKVCKEIYDLRETGKDHSVNGKIMPARKYYKQVLTNTVGFMQSLDNNFNMLCPELSRAAIQWTYDKVVELINKLKEAGYIPLLSNTDGIWYYKPDNISDWYHGEGEGTNIGEWSNEYIGSKMRVFSKGAYDFLTPDGMYKPVARGRLAIEKTRPRETWTWEENMLAREADIGEPEKYRFNTDKGFVPYEDWEYGYEKLIKERMEREI